MSKNYKVISNNYGKGNNSQRFLIEENASKRLLKITDNREDYVASEYTPKLFSINNPDFTDLNTDNVSFIYEYEFIDGDILSECVVDDNLFVKIIKMLLFFFSNNYFVWDCHIDNIVVREGKPFFVDFGGIEKQPYNKIHLIFDFLPTDCPEEFLAGNYPKSCNTEAFTIYWIADQLIKRCALNLSKKSSSILTKMHSKTIVNRYGSFAEIIEMFNH